MADLIFVDTDILIDAGRGVSEAIAYLQQIEQRSSRWRETGGEGTCTI